LKLGITYNVKKETELEESLEKVNKRNTEARKYLDENIIEKYSERIDDTFAEWDSIETIEAIKNAFEKAGHEIILIEADENAFETLRLTKPQIVFNVAEGKGGASRESQLPAILEMLDIPYTGSDPVSIGICHDKSRCKEILSYYNIPNSKFFISDNDEVNHNLSYPLFVKPLHEGSSKGIYNSSVVHNPDELKKEIKRIKECYDQPSLVEEYLDGKEFTVALLGNGNDLKVLPIVEINLDEVPNGFNKIYSYEVKWFFDTRENKLDIFKCPAEIDSELYKKIEETCKDTFNVLRLKDWARMDVRLDKNGIPNIIEINPLPGILPDPEDNSCFPKAAREAGMNYDECLNAVLNSAIKRYDLI